MKLYNIEISNVYPDAKARTIRGHEDRAIIICTNHMSNYEYYPCEAEGHRMDSSVLLSGCMGFDPETFDPASDEVREWVVEWTYPVEIAKAIVSQINSTPA